MPRLPHPLKLDPPYDAKLEGILCFREFADAEETLRKLEVLRRQFLAAHDDKGVDSCRAVALLGRRRAESISRNRRVDPNLRRQKAEIAGWFQLWLENPEVFSSWIEMRKLTEEYKELRNAAESKSVQESQREAPHTS